MKYIKLLVLVFLLPLASFCQRITYSEPERDDSRAMDFDIIGKLKGNYLVYKGVRNSHRISVYDNNLKVRDETELTFLPDRIIDADFIAYPDYVFMIYEYQRKGILYCMGVKLDSLGKKLGEPKELDTTSVGLLSDNKIYNVSYSDDRQKVMVYKIQRKSEKFYYTTVLFNSRMELQKKSRMLLTYDERRNVLSDFLIDNDGNFVFALGHKSGLKDYINKVSLVVKETATDSFAIHNIETGKIYLDELQLKVDNPNRHYIISSFYYTKKHGDIEGLFSAVWGKDQSRQTVESMIPFSDTLKAEAKTEGPQRMAFNNFFIKNITLKRDGGYIIAGEDYYTQSNSNPWNRMDYLYNYPYSSYDYYSPGSYNNYRWRSYNNNSSQARYYYDNIAVFSLDTAGKMQWNNIIHKSQYDDDTDNFLSFAVFNAGSQLHFLFNEKERKNQLLSDAALQPDGEVLRNPTLKSLDRGYEFMPRLGKQVSAREVIVPCYYRNYI